MFLLCSKFYLLFFLSLSALLYSFFLWKQHLFWRWGNGKEHWKEEHGGCSQKTKMLRRTRYSSSEVLNNFCNISYTWNDRLDCERSSAWQFKRAQDRSHIQGRMYYSVFWAVHVSLSFGITSYSRIVGSYWIAVLLTDFDDRGRTVMKW